MPKDLPTCATCIHLGELRSKKKEKNSPICLAPITTEPPKDGETKAKNGFVYRTTPNSSCEMHTPSQKI